MFTDTSDFHQFVQPLIPPYDFHTEDTLVKGGLDKAPKHLWKHGLATAVKKYAAGDDEWNPLIKEQLKKMYKKSQPVTRFYTSTDKVSTRTKEAVERLCMFILLQNESTSIRRVDGVPMRNPEHGDYRPEKTQKHLMERLGTFYELLTRPEMDQKSIYKNDVKTIERKIWSLFQKMDPERRAFYLPHVEQDLAQLKQYHKKMK
jgi:hypothetical protein